jgi:hypothetical protein
MPIRSSIAVILVAMLAADSAPTLAKPPVVLIAGDIAAGKPDSKEAATADVIRRTRGLVMTAGDNVQGNGALREFRDWYRPTWGRFRGRTFATPGNHEYRMPGARAYFRYFGRRAGPAGRGYYTFRHGTWRVVSLDSEPCMSPPGCGRGTAQYRWLRRLLATSSERCMLTVWHRPLFSSGAGGNQPRVRPLFRLLYRYGADVVVNGHHHHYERMAPVRPWGRVDRPFGIRQFTVGTGGGKLGPKGVSVVRQSEVLHRRTHGVLRLTLRRGSYDWRFLPVVGKAFSDSGSARCHGKPRPGG